MNESRQMELGAALAQGTLNVKSLNREEATWLVEHLEKTMKMTQGMSMEGGDASAMPGTRVMLVINAKDLATCGYPDVERRFKAVAAARAADVEAVKTAQSKKKEGGWCFVATAACGSPFAADVLVLQEFRDRILRQWRAGRIFIRLYETFSPPLARLISNSEFLKSITRTLIVRPARKVADRCLRSRDS